MGVRLYDWLRSGLHVGLYLVFWVSFTSVFFGLVYLAGVLLSWYDLCIIVFALLCFLSYYFDCLVGF